MASFAIYCGATNYTTLIKVIHDLNNGNKLHQTVSARNHVLGSSSFDPKEEKKMKILTSMVRMYPRVTHVESKIDSLIYQFASLALVMRKSQKRQVN